MTQLQLQVNPTAFIPFFDQGLMAFLGILNLVIYYIIMVMISVLGIQTKDMPKPINEMNWSEWFDLFQPLKAWGKGATIGFHALAEAGGVLLNNLFDPSAWTRPQIIMIIWIGLGALLIVDMAHKDLVSKIPVLWWGLRVVILLPIRIFLLGLYFSIISTVVVVVTQSLDTVRLRSLSWMVVGWFSYNLYLTLSPGIPAIKDWLATTRFSKYLGDRKTEQQKKQAKERQLKRENLVLTKKNKLASIACIGRFADEMLKAHKVKPSTKSG